MALLLLPNELLETILQDFDTRALFRGAASCARLWTLFARDQRRARLECFDSNLLLLILAYLGTEDLLHVATTCRRFHFIVHAFFLHAPPLPLLRWRLGAQVIGARARERCEKAHGPFVAEGERVDLYRERLEEMGHNNYGPPMLDGRRFVCTSYGIFPVEYDCMSAADVSWSSCTMDESFPSSALLGHTFPAVGGSLHRDTSLAQCALGELLLGRDKRANFPICTPVEHTFPGDEEESANHSVSVQMEQDFPGVGDDSANFPVFVRMEHDFPSAGNENAVFPVSMQMDNHDFPDIEDTLQCDASAAGNFTARDVFRKYAEAGNFPVSSTSRFEVIAFREDSPAGAARTIPKGAFQDATISFSLPADFFDFKQEMSAPVKNCIPASSSHVSPPGAAKLEATYRTADSESLGQPETSTWKADPSACQPMDVRVSARPHRRTRARSESDCCGSPKATWSDGSLDSFREGAGSSAASHRHVVRTRAPVRARTGSEGDIVVGMSRPMSSASMRNVRARGVFSYRIPANSAPAPEAEPNFPSPFLLASNSQTPNLPTPDLVVLGNLVPTLPTQILSAPKFPVPVSAVCFESLQPALVVCNAVERHVRDLHCWFDGLFGRRFTAFVLHHPVFRLTGAEQCPADCELVTEHMLCSALGLPTLEDYVRFAREKAAAEAEPVLWKVRPSVNIEEDSVQSMTLSTDPQPDGDECDAPWEFWRSLLDSEDETVSLPSDVTQGARVHPFSLRFDPCSRTDDKAGAARFLGSICYNQSAAERLHDALFALASTAYRVELKSSRYEVYSHTKMFFARGNGFIYGLWATVGVYMSNSDD